MKVKNKVMVVTGGASGIGRALILELVNKGAKIAAVDINEENLMETRTIASDHQGRISTHILDITDRKAVDALPERVLQAHGAVDGLINNAGIIQPFIHISKLDQAMIKRVMNINFFGMVNMTKAFLPHLMERTKAHITNVSSMGGFFPFAGQTLYGASKAAVKLFSEGLYLELGETNIGVTTVYPGAIKTNITKNSNVTIKGFSDSLMERFTLTSPQIAAKKIVKAIEFNRYQAYIGIDAIALNILYRINPRWTSRFMFKQMKLLLSD